MRVRGLCWWEYKFVQPLWRTACVCVCVHVFICVQVFVAAPPDYSLPSFSKHGIFQAISEWVALSFSRGSSWLRDWTCMSYIGRWILLPLSHQGSPSVLTLNWGNWNSEKQTGHAVRSCRTFHHTLPLCRLVKWHTNATSMELKEFPFSMKGVSWS